MKQRLLQERYPIYCLEIGRRETNYRTVEEIIGYFKERIEEHRWARFIGVFDHFAHTQALPEGQIDEDILAAQIIIFCFGLTLPDPHALAVRPRTIGVAETSRGFTISFMEAPMPVANTAMEDWALGLRRREGRAA